MIRPPPRSPLFPSPTLSRSSSPINFTAVFSGPVSGFTGAGVTISGTAGGTKTVTVSGGPSTYNVAVSGMTTSGTVIAPIAAGVGRGAAGKRQNTAPTTPNTVTVYTPGNTPPPGDPQPPPRPGLPSHHVA